eukprot:scaffold27982_cov31-Tisochrysis_lutea.AAC.6
MMLSWLPFRCISLVLATLSMQSCPRPHEILPTPIALCASLDPPEKSIPVKASRHRFAAEQHGHSKSSGAPQRFSHLPGTASSMLSAFSFGGYRSRKGMRCPAHADRVA